MQDISFRKFWLIGVAIAFLSNGCERAIEYLPPLPRVEIPSNQSRKPALASQSASTAKIEAGVGQSINQVRLLLLVDVKDDQITQDKANL
ncbi:hypothetical protein [Fischerella thermalis]|uniref:Uncharacterized protein n=1 Tax=Fischerella thermalis JSC-11 TaxID=741277 RepID=G6FPD6_9CYAN|nr:hypothetical protein [Fischerella thermalis]PLZ32188.1 hypothetical protein CBP28_05395 [Fischerella thermalis WC559]PLZ96206.1 hypothetical protein CI592_21635 [Fischerella thermalis CCMEE 5328]PMB11717.1 hypothetical protein CEN49_00965 [Fischerella thermalis CCMEE 5273]EHC18736.1 hypothetical protein FJSC11DRAFT_0716 [Fischerella thermalis JSC-11]PLZ10220.1 hypothetical protein CBP18_11040 [Fischerella thermalis WC119]